jgi:hypothetical protein
MGQQCRFGWSGGAREVSRAAVLRPVVGGGLGCLTRGGRGTMGPSGLGALGRPISEKKQKEKIETGRATRGFWAKIKSGHLRKIKIVFNFLMQGNGIQIKRFKYFQTKFELDSK